jgi:uncharacterized protein (DUF4415 family)
MARKPKSRLIPYEEPELTDAELAEMRPAREVLPAKVYATLTAGRRGRPPKADPKVAVKLRLDRAILTAFRASGAGWQTRINEVLLRAVKRQRRATERDSDAG